MTQQNAQQLALIQSEIAANQLDSAAQRCTDALRIAPQSAALWSALSQISLRTGQVKVAINAALKAIDCAPTDPRHVFHLAGCYLQLQIFSAAHKALRHAQQLINNSQDAELWDKLGELWYMANCLDDAIDAHRRALSVQPDNVSTRNQLGALLRFTGNLDDAEQLYRQALTLQPDNVHACYNLAQLRRYPQADELILKVEDCQRRLPADHSGQVMLHYALGKLYEDSQAYSAAFSHFAQGAALKRQQRPYDVNHDVRLMQATAGFFRDYPHQVATPASPPAQVPIFVVGLPRTGTTLVERIIASHSEVVSGDELNALPMALLEAGGRGIGAGIDGLDDSLIAQLSPSKMQWLGERYLTLANNYVKHAPIFVDKLPYNFLYCGFILHALPQAKIVHVKRNPFDAALSNYKMLFDRGYEYSYRLQDTADFILAYERLMTQWKKLFPGQIHTVEYEELVQHQESETRALLRFCDLSWQPRCLDFHHNASATHTASASQVREPIHSRSINLWRNYEQHLSPLVNAFAKHGITPPRNEEKQW